MRILDQLADLNSQLPKMPVHTDNYAKMLRTFSQGFPKDLMEYSAFLDNHFLNDNLAVIEEIQHRQPSHPIPKWFREYQRKYYQKYGILNHDNFFKARLNHGFRKHLSPNLTEVREVGFMGNTRGLYNALTGKVLGPEVETDGSSSGSPNFGANHLECAKSTGIVSGDYYNYLKFDLSGGAGGNVRVGLYSDSSGPDALLSESASLTAVADYTTTYAITEVQINASAAWLTHNQDSGSSHWSYWNSVTARWYRSGFAYGAFPNPWGGVTNDTNNAPRMKTGGQ